MHYLIVLFGCLISGTLGKYYFVTVPNVIRYEYDETVTVSVFGLNNAAVDVWLQLGDKKLSEKPVVVPGEDSPTTTHVRLTEKDISDYLTKEEVRPSLIKICSKYGADSDCQEVLISYETGYIILQTDKPIYTPKQRVKIRALVFDESLKAVKNQTVAMDIVSPSNMTLGRTSITKSSSGFYMNEFELPPHPEIGLWTARAFLKGQYDTNSRIMFGVEEYVLPTFGVEIEVDLPYILEDSETVSITVKAKYVYGKPVNGKARLDLNLRGDAGKDSILSTTKQRLVTTGNQNSVTTFKIPVADLMASQAIGNLFPDGKKMEIIATVYEDETGNEENGVHGSTMFTKNPYQFKFTQSKLNFRPGMEYFLKLEMLHANGAPAPEKEIELLIYENNELKNTKLRRTDLDGNILESFPTTHKSKELKFMVRTKDQKWKSDDFKVSPYNGKNQIQVEMVTVDGRNQMRAYTNTQQGGYTGMMFMVVSRGKVVYTKFQQQQNKVSVEMTNAIEKMVSPSGRLIVFYVDTKTDEIVADSVKFNVHHVCQGKPLSMQSDRMEIKPGATSKLTIDGDPLMHVGLNIMDKALLLLNNKNVLRRNVMFDTLESHDLGCGEGSGSDSAGVFKSTGLTVLTNAKITKAGLQRNKIDCEARLRKKRQALDNICSNVDPTCCEMGDQFAIEALESSYDIKNMVAFTECLVYAKAAYENGTVPMQCIDAMFYTCKHIITMVQNPTISGRSLDLETDYITDLERLIQNKGQLITRTDFRESWQFTVMTLDQKGEKSLRLGYPDSITEWMIQGIGISDEGVCIADPVNVTVYKDFFVQLEIPYKATRLEHLEVKATIFNYGHDNKTAHVYLEGLDELCYDRGSGNPSEKTVAQLSPNSAHTIRFPMVPMKKGNLPVTVSAIVYDHGSPEADAVKKYLLVENEGIEEKIAIQVCLDPLEQTEDCAQHPRVHVVSDTITKHGVDANQVLTVDLTLPQNSIPTTGTATGYLQGNLMDNVVRTLLENGVESLFRQPAGCGEQTMIRLAPTVSAMKYLKQTKQMTDAIEETGNKYIRDGVNREIVNYRQPKGGYAAWQSRPASTWLTAFVSKIFCQAKTVIDDAVDKDDIAMSIDWLVGNVRPDGSFGDNQPVIHREMIGQIKENQGASLTAFVLVTLQECDIQVARGKDTISKAMRYLERMDEHTLRNNPYILALSTYALAMSKSHKSGEFYALLKDTKIHSKEDGSHWGKAGGFPANADSVETTAYALLAALQNNDIKTSGEIVRWLTSQRDARGAFRTTQDTVVGLQALSEYSMRTYSRDLDLKISLLANNWRGQQFSVTNKTSVYQQVIKRLPVENGDNKLKIEVSGTGTGRMMIDLRYNRQALKNEKCGFNVSDITVHDVPDLDRNIAQLGKCDVCNKCENKEEPPEYYDEVAFGRDVIEPIPRIGSRMGRIKRAQGGRGKRATAKKLCLKFSVSAAYKETGMTLVRVGLETGVEVVEEDLEKLIDETENIDAYEYDGNGFVVFYLNKGSFTKTNFIFRLIDTFDDKGGQRSRQPAALTVYDYYNPDQTCTKMYRSIGEPFSYQCDNSDKPQCMCIQNMCVKPSMGDTIAKWEKTPAMTLFKYTCKHDKADYAVKVVISGLSYDADTEQKIATAKVLKSIHKGSKKQERNSEMTFFYPLSCREPQLKKGDKAYIIGKDGSKFTNKDGHEAYQYPMMGTTLVIKEPKVRKRRYGMIMRKYEHIMATRGCVG